MRYSALQIVLHWAVAVLVLVQWFTYDAIVRTHNPLLGASPSDLFEHKVHNYSGILIGALIGLRVLLRFARRRSGDGTRPPWYTDWSRWAHWALYALLFAQAFSGFVASYVSPAAIPVHRALWTLVWPIIGIHIAAAGYHLLRRDGVVGRMFRTS